MHSISTLLADPEFPARMGDREVRLGLRQHQGATMNGKASERDIRGLKRALSAILPL